jgi:hypothetical protein
MLTQAEADTLIAMKKHPLRTNEEIHFPFPGSTERIELVSADGRERFILDLERGRLADKWKLQLRYRSTYILVRLDINGPGHLNPRNAPHRRLSRYAGRRIPTPHIQQYVEGFGDNWALPLPQQFTDPSDVSITWREFLQYCNIVDTPNLQGSF